MEQICCDKTQQHGGLQIYSEKQNVEVELRQRSISFKTSDQEEKKIRPPYLLVENWKEWKSYSNQQIKLDRIRQRPKAESQIITRLPKPKFKVIPSLSKCRDLQCYNPPPLDPPSFNQKMPQLPPSKNTTTKDNKGREHSHVIYKKGSPRPLPPLIMPVNDVYRDYLHYFKSLGKWLKDGISIYQTRQAPCQLEYETDQFIMAIRQYLDCCCYMFHIEHKTFLKDNMIRLIWMTAVYDPICILRSIENSPSLLALGAKLIQLGIEFYETLLEDIQVIYGLNLKAVIGGSVYLSEIYTPIPRRPVTCKRNLLRDFDTSNIGHISDTVYRICVYIGDAGRYGKKLRNDLFDKSLKYYNAAIHVDGSKGRTFYQLGVVWLSKKNYTLAMYNFLSAYFAKTPVVGGFDQIKEVYDQAYKMHNSEKEKFWYNLSKQKEDVIPGRNFVEDWIIIKANNTSPNFNLFKKPNFPPPTKKEHIESLLRGEIYYRFNLTYALVFGKLYERIGLDDIEEVAEECLVYFEALIQKDYGFLNHEKMVQIAFLGIKIADKVFRDPDKNGIVDYLTIFVLHFLLEIFSLAADQLRERMKVRDQWTNSYFLALCAALNVWGGWLMLDKTVTVWSTKIHAVRPSFCISRIEKSRNVNCEDLRDDKFGVIAKFATELQTIMDCNDEKIMNSAYNSYFQKLFPDDVSSTTFDKCPRDYIEKLEPTNMILKGFGDLKCYGIDSDNYYYYRMDHKYFKAKHALLSRQFTLLRRFIDVCVHIKFLICIPTEKVDEYHHHFYKSVIEFKRPPNINETQCGVHEGMHLYWASETPHELLKPTLDGFPPIPLLRGDCNNARIILKSTTYKSNKIKDLWPHLTSIQNAWRKLKEKGFATEMYVLVKRIVIDTNCFINNLERVISLTELLDRPLILPVTDVLELRGLRKGGLRPKYREKLENQDTEEAHEKLSEGNETAEKSKLALDFINKNLTKFQIVTTTGKIRPVTNCYEMITDENYDPKERNDNRIINTCIKLEENDLPLRKKNTTLRLYRGTVLITNDRGLHVKSNVNDIPVRQIESLVAWIVQGIENKIIQHNNKESKVKEDDTNETPNIVNLS